jgi:hypothetical protein
MQRRLYVLAVVILLAAGWGMLAGFVATGYWGKLPVLIAAGWRQKSPLVGKWITASKISRDVLDADGTVIGKYEESEYIEFNADGAVVRGGEDSGGIYGEYKVVDRDQLDLDFGRYGKGTHRFSVNGDKLGIEVDARRFGQTTLLFQRAK